jgi:pseudouridine synthase
MTMRVQKFLAHQGIASRRAIEKMINDGRIVINGKIVTEQGTKVDPEKDKIAVDGKVIKSKETNVYYWINKPVGIISAASSRAGDTTVVDLVDSNVRMYPVGRLDKDSEGLLLLTNDGELTHRLTHPKYHIDKTYRVFVVGHISDKKITQLETGILLEEGMTAPATVNVIEETKEGTWLEFIIHEGKHRQIRRMCEKVNLQVVTLIRTAMGPVKLQPLVIGEYRPATKSEISTLKSLVGLS